MLMPRRVKHKKQFHGSMTGKVVRGNRIVNGSFGLIAQEPCRIRSNQIEAAHVALARYTKRGDKTWIKIFPDEPVTVRLAEARMGSDRGFMEYWVVVVRPGCVLSKIDGVAEADARGALHLTMHKLSCKCKITSKEEVDAGVDGVSAVTAEGGEQSENE